MARASRHAVSVGHGMRVLLLLAIAGLGFALGWYARGPERPSSSPRATVERTVAERPPEPGRPPPPAQERPARAEAPPEPPPPAPEAAETPAEEDPFREMIRAQRPQMKAMSAMQARQKLEAPLKDLGFDAETTKRILDLLLKEAETQTERAYGMFLGEAELDPEAFLWMWGVGPTLSEETERDLAAFLGDPGVETVRAKLKAVHEKQMDDLAEMSVNMMAIPDLTPEQRVQLKRHFAGNDVMQEQMTQFADVFRDREKMRKLMSGDGLAEEMERSAAPRREKMRAILNDAQFERYKEWEGLMVKQAEMGLKMMGGLQGKSE